MAQQLILVSDGDLTIKLTDLKRHDGDAVKALNESVVGFLPKLSIFDHAGRILDHDSTEVPDSIEVRVSSSHLSYSSPAFRCFIRGDVLGSLVKDGHASLHLPEDDAGATVIVLNALYQKNRSIPKKVSLQTLHEICVVVDKYGLHEALEPHTTRWYSTLRADPLPSFTVREETVNWLCIAHVLDDKFMFDRIVSSAQFQLAGPIQADCLLPLPGNLLENMEEKRVRFLEEVEKIVKNMILRYKIEQICRSTLGSQKDCDALVLGILQRKLIRSGLLNCDGNVESGISIQQAINAINDLYVQKRCDGNMLHCPDPRKELQDNVNEIKKGLGIDVGRRMGPFALVSFQHR